MEINKPMAARNMLASTLTDYRKPVKLPKITVELDPELKKRFKAEAVRRGTTIRDMLTAWIEHDCPPLDAADARAEAKQDGRRSG
ncbi:ribbon-helix-helix protein [Bifidobacterium bifidum]|uniref:ribbon-helix-helix protein n=1 Tax=Bifidobacterium bifidum TaxID=1681 RepID=UPI0031EA018B